MTLTFKLPLRAKSKSSASPIFDELDADALDYALFSDAAAQSAEDLTRRRAEAAFAAADAFMERGDPTPAA